MKTRRALRSRVRRRWLYHEPLVVFGGMVDVARRDCAVGDFGMGLPRELDSIRPTASGGAIGDFAVRFDFVPGVHIVSTGMGSSFEEDESAGGGGDVRRFAQYGDARYCGDEWG